MAQVLLENLVKVYPDKSAAGMRVVRGIDLEIRDREFMVLVGPSGCGKSTTLRMIAGLEEITEGQIRIDGAVVNATPPKDRDIAMVFQNYALYPHLSVYDNMAFGLKLRKRPKAEIDARVREAAQLLGLEPYLARRPRALSGGQRQRVAVGRAIVRQPKVFLFDEPLSNLDAKMRVAMRAELVRLHRRLGATMIYVTHDQAEAMTMGDRICVMNEGRIMQVAAPMELYDRPANLFVAGFIGTPPMNLLHGTLQRDTSGLRFVETNSAACPVEIALAAPLASRTAGRTGRPAVLGLRPENLHEDPAPDSAAALRVELVEPMGAETFLTLHTGAHALVARVRPGTAAEIGQPFRIGFDAARAHLFDPETGQRL